MSQLYSEEEKRSRLDRFMVREKKTEYARENNIPEATCKQSIWYLIEFLHITLNY